MDKLLDAQDELDRARNKVRLIGMTAAIDPDPDQKAIATGCELIEERFEEAFRLLEEFKAETRCNPSHAASASRLPVEG